MSLRRIKVCLVAGGTGGHLIPAVAFGQWLTRQSADIQVTYLCGSRKLEEEIFAHHGIQPRKLPLEGSPLGRGGITAIRRWGQLVTSVPAACGILRQERPDFICHFGGYLCFPVMIAARSLGLKQVTHEQNARSGRVTRLARRMGIPVACGWPVCDPFKKGEEFFFTGVPVRPFERLQRSDAWHKLRTGRPVPEGPILSVFGGSLGSTALMAMAANLVDHPKFRNWTVLEIGTVMDMSCAKDRFFRLPKTWDLAPVFSLTDLALCRGGASSLWELLLLKIPALVVPWRGASDDHQLANAHSFKDLGGGLFWIEGTDPIERIPTLLEQISQTQRQLLPAGQNDTITPHSGDGVCQSLWRVLTDKDCEGRGLYGC
ncbi:MAG: UDP-N-acetylglucosamine--N-acetylmuramyl-(pentapeptide) pyrophosphoryl-undecaprenol N-acetylglucosamine transferase [Synergistaceae bacterium]|nr:UDP-N-acetylglucosamine--N-acetylmuramyl-(pentapeptide) pyrophosphoryl-undecaprenol N-acetylglucosamine transferase [Synergistaceae bacterium]